MSAGHVHLLTDLQSILRFALSGNARLTLVSKKTGARFTFRIRRRENTPFFVQLMNGPSNETNYVYMGFVHSHNHTYNHGRKSTITEHAPSAVAFSWVWANLQRGIVPEGVEIWHEGQCGRCGRALTDPASIEIGIGPECIKHVH